MNKQVTVVVLNKINAKNSFKEIKIENTYLIARSTSNNSLQPDKSRNAQKTKTTTMRR